MSLTPEEKRAVEAALAILERPEDHAPLTNRLMLERNMAYHERTAVYGYLAGDRDGYRRGVEAAIHRCVGEGMLWMASELRALLAQEES